MYAFELRGHTAICMLQAVETQLLKQDTEVIDNLYKLVGLQGLEPGTDRL